MRPHQLLLLLSALAAADASRKCDKTHINIASLDEVDFTPKVFETSIARCKTKTENVPRAFKLPTPNQDKFYGLITCTEEGGWKAKEWAGGGTDVDLQWPGPATGLAVTCAEYCTAGDSAQNDGEKIKKELQVDGKVRVTCNDAARELNWKDAPVEGNYAACTIKDIWKAGFTATNTDVIKQVSMFACKAAASKCTFLDEAVNKFLRFEDSSKTLKCDPIDHTMAAVKIGDNSNAIFESIVCNPATGQWKDPSVTGAANADITGATSAAGPLQVACVEYCAATGGRIAAEVKDVSGVPTREITCAKLVKGQTKSDDPFLGMFFDGKPVASGTASCTKEKGWAAQNVNDPKAPQQIECKRACEHDELKYIDFLVEGDKKSFTPKCPKTGGKAGIRLNDKFTYERLKCAKIGWTDDKKAIVLIASAFEKAKLRCVNVNCDHIASCPDELTGKLKGYECIKDISTSPIDQLVCPNQYVFYDFGNAVEISADKLKCKGSSDEKWYDIESDFKRTVIGRELILGCVRKRCGKCEILKGVEKADFTSGAAQKCATVKCKRNLWSVKRAGSADLEQYAGEVTCSSEKATDSKWLIDEQTPIEEGSCIKEADQDAVKCTVAAPVDTKCNQTWPASVGCAEIALSDADKIECPKGKQIFFKQRTDKWNEYKGGKGDIVCWRGAWNVTLSHLPMPVELNRGGNVLCADKSPNPPIPVDKKEVDRSSEYLLIGSSAVALLLFVYMIAVAVYKRTGSGYRLLTPNY